VKYDEGLVSYKAIAFIASKSNQNRLIKQTISYLKLGANLQQIVLNNQETPRGFSKNLGEKTWIK